MLNAFVVDWSGLSPKEKLLELTGAVLDPQIAAEAGAAGIPVPRALQLSSEEHACKMRREAFETWYTDVKRLPARTKVVLATMGGVTDRSTALDAFWSSLDREGKEAVLMDAVDDNNTRSAAESAGIDLTLLDRNTGGGMIAEVASTLAAFGKWMGASHGPRRSFIRRSFEAAERAVRGDLLLEQYMPSPKSMGQSSPEPEPAPEPDAQLEAATNSNVAPSDAGGKVTSASALADENLSYEEAEVPQGSCGHDASPRSDSASRGTGQNPAAYIPRGQDDVHPKQATPLNQGTRGLPLEEKSDGKAMLPVAQLL